MNFSGFAACVSNFGLESARSCPCVALRHVGLVVTVVAPMAARGALPDLGDGAIVAEAEGEVCPDEADAESLPDVREGSGPELGHLPVGRRRARMRPTSSCASGSGAVLP